MTQDNERKTGSRQERQFEEERQVDGWSFSHSERERKERRKAKLNKEDNRGNNRERSESERERSERERERQGGQATASPVHQFNESDDGENNRGDQAALKSIAWALYEL